jgi:hAT family C-terminal dimerisation region
VLDVLPVQASSVACERVFSSSKETITMHRSRLSTELMEVLQFLKYTYQQDRLNLMEGLMMSEKELLDAQTLSISTDEVRELLVNGQISSLIGLLNGEAS